MLPSPKPQVTQGGGDNTSLIGNYVGSQWTGQQIIGEEVEKIVKDNKYDVVLIDTAGRLQNKVNLMKELEKINKVTGNIIPNAPQETLLVIDATTGQNGISQAVNFSVTLFILSNSFIRLSLF
jgi:signal recognition particle GTPase